MKATPPVTRTDILHRIKELKEQIDVEELQRHEVRQTPEYKAVEADIATNEDTMRELAQEGQALRARMQEMTAAIPNSTMELTTAKQELIALMQLEGVEGYTEDWITVSGKWSEKKSVNGRRLLEVLGGDIDEFTKLAQPTQKAVKDMAAMNEALEARIAAMEAAVLRQGRSR